MVLSSETPQNNKFIKSEEKDYIVEETIKSFNFKNPNIDHRTKVK